MNQNFKVLSLFSSAGIGELGIEAAGLSILVSNELLQNRCDLYRENYPNVDNICGDIWGKEEEIIDRWHEQDIRSLAVEIATLTRRQQRGRGLWMA